jgi:hypothetical protein
MHRCTLTAAARDCRRRPSIDVPWAHAQAVALILSCVRGKTVRVCDLPMPSDAERMDLVLCLHEWGALGCSCLLSAALRDYSNHSMSR